jgi:hypothetical protein
MDETVTPKQRQIRVERARSDDLQKIELRIQDVKEVEIPMRILNKLKRKMKRN